MEVKNKKEKIYCPNCGSENPYSTDYCFCCGRDLKSVKEEIERAEQRRKEALDREKENITPKPATKSSSTFPKIFLLPILLVAVCVILIAAVYGLGKKGENSASSGTPMPDESAAAEEHSQSVITTSSAGSGFAESESAESEPAGVLYQIKSTAVDYAAYPEILVYMNVQDEAGAPAESISESAIKARGAENILTVTSVENAGSGTYVVSLKASDTASVYDLMNVQNLSISIDGTDNENSISFVPGEEMMTQMMDEFHNAFIEDINVHTLNKMLDYMETDVDYDDHAALINQMRTEITGGFLTCIAQSLQSCQVTDVFAEDENTFHVNVTLKVDGVFEEPYAVWKNESSAVAAAITEFLGNVSDDTNIRLYSYVTEYCEYLVRKSGDGSYKVYCYTGDISLAKKWQVYNAQVVS